MFSKWQETWERLRVPRPWGNGSSPFYKKFVLKRTWRSTGFTYNKWPKKKSNKKVIRELNCSWLTLNSVGRSCVSILSCAERQITRIVNGSMDCCRRCWSEFEAYVWHISLVFDKDGNDADRFGICNAFTCWHLGNDEVTGDNTPSQERNSEILLASHGETLEFVLDSIEINPCEIDKWVKPFETYCSCKSSMRILEDLI